MTQKAAYPAALLYYFIFMVKTQNQEITSLLIENTVIFSALTLLAHGIGCVCLKEQRPYSKATEAERKAQFCIQASSCWWNDTRADVQGKGGGAGI